MSEKRYKLSIIMVCYNAAKVIEKTLISLAEQSFKDYEFVVKDGNSKDKTLDIIENYKSRFSNCFIISESDSGIYDAMNTAVRKASGEYIYFLNAGDCFYEPHTLERIIKYLNADICYGNIIYGNILKVYPDKLNYFYFLCEHMVCHQAIFSKRVLLQKFPFASCFQYCADRHWFCQCIKDGASYKHMDEIIGYYDITGVSSDIDKFQKDSINVIWEEFGILGVLFVKGKRVIGKILKK